MSEPGPAQNYSTQGEQDNRVHHCPECKTEIGVEIERDGKLYLMVGNARLYHLPGECAACGHRLYWEPGWRKLQQAIKRLKQPMPSSAEIVEQAKKQAR